MEGFTFIPEADDQHFDHAPVTIWTTQSELFKSLFWGETKMGHIKEELKVRVFNCIV